MLNLIGGHWTSAASGATFDVSDPATDEVLDEVPDASTDEFAAAVDAAAGALSGWQSLRATERADVLDGVVAACELRLDELAVTIARESGKPLSEARGEVRYALGFLSWAAGEAVRVGGETIPAAKAGQRILVLRQPVGVSAAITPWNFPLAMITRKLGPALAVGCTQVVKPAPETPLSALLFAEVASDAGVPDGVLNVVTGDPVAFSNVVFGDARVRMVSFTGSTEVGRELIRQSAKNVTRLSLELGGHAPVFVLEDADLDQAVTMTMAAKYRNTGQSCVAASRVRVASSRYEELCAALADRSSKLRLGRWDEGADLGPLINDEAVAKVQRHVDDAVVRGAQLLCGGKAVSPGPGLAGRFFEATVLAGVDDSMVLCHEETFGPVIAIEPFDDVDEAVAAANASPFGLAAYVAGRDAGRVLDVVEALECGVVGVNDGVPSTPQAPFGGMKLSGIGREGGHWVMDEYLETKYVSLVF